MHRRVLIDKKAFHTLLHLSRSAHPNEMVALLRGRVKEDIIVEEVLLAPLSLAGENFSEFPLDALPVDPTIIGTAHSHPVHDLTQSDEDIAEGYGRVSIVVAYPYKDLEDVAAYSASGEKLRIVVMGEGKV